MDRDELGAWLGLLERPGIGRASARRLLAAFGSPQAVLAAPSAARREVLARGSTDPLAGDGAALDPLIDRTWAWLSSAPTRAVVTLGDARYPQALLETADPPVLLYLEGRAELLSSPAFAIVGSRNPTPQGKDNARAFAKTLGEAGLTIVSGMALGIDAAAHEGGLPTPAGTIAVVGTGLDLTYPVRNRALALRIAAEGLVVSEFALGSQPLPQHFPMRNRIIAGLARGTLVVEAALQSGSLITARLAVEAGREVFAIPGSIHSPLARGCHALIKQGAKLVESAQDILEELRIGVPAAAPADAAPLRGDPILDALGHDPVSLDALVARTGWPASDLNIRLLDLELEGRVARLPGQLFQRIGRG
ncbi:MAG: DNA-protecting protein DprA [Proteobacteria bacterium]|nr:DNA-protecting protein DprA [Pseudomonadota bacterium]